MIETDSMWKFGSNRKVLEHLVAGYSSTYDALYEYPKNLEEAGANRINIDFNYDKSVIVVYGDGKGMGIPELSLIRDKIAISEKDRKHKGIGLMSFLRFSKNMVMFSKKDKIINVMSCAISGDNIVSDTGAPRQMDEAVDAVYEIYYKKMSKWAEGTVTIFEGVGKYKSDQYHFFTFDMNVEFEEKKFEKWYKEKAKFKLLSHTYMLKFGDKKPSKVEAKLGHGKKVDFSIPSDKYPAKDIPGEKKDIFEDRGHRYRLKTDFQFHISPANDGEIKISDNWQDAISINDLNTGGKLTRSSIYYNMEYLRYLNGHINFKVEPLNGGPQFDVYSGSRSKILALGPFGDCLVNILIHADQEIIRPMIENKEDTSLKRKYEARTKDLQADMESYFRANKDLFDAIINTRNVDAVSDRNYHTCPKCRFVAIPKRCTTEEYQADSKKTNHIYAPLDLSTYICGSCGHKWPRKMQDRSESSYTHRQTQKPVYDRSSSEGITIRKKEKGYGYTFVLFDFGRSDSRDAFLPPGHTQVKINTAHPNYKILESNTIAIRFYERQMAISVILNKELQNFPREQFEQFWKDSFNRLLKWYYIDRKSPDQEEYEEVEDKPAETRQVLKTAEPSKPVARPVARVPDIKSLGEQWGAKVSTGK